MKYSRMNTVTLCRSFIDKLQWDSPQHRFCVNRFRHDLRRSHGLRIPRADSEILPDLHCCENGRWNYTYRIPDLCRANTMGTPIKHTQYRVSLHRIWV
jgi:hypothetical protein